MLRRLTCFLRGHDVGRVHVLLRFAEIEMGRCARCGVGFIAHTGENTYVTLRDDIFFFALQDIWKVEELLRSVQEDK